MSEEIATHESRWRDSTVYDVPAPPRDPSTSDATTSWPMVLVLLLLVPPLGWLQLRHRTDVELSVRIAVAVVAGVLWTAAWTTALRLQPWA
ncbi:MAG TPA: hypothetical protein VFL59_01480 [Candidatus Nanopelagicales bacterium]|nr:hypothetical protein [Candidatus Nanopelagicales bacterium]